MPSPDNNLDAQLRTVGIPDGLLQRLRAIPLGDDEGLDALLNEVPERPGLVARLQTIPWSDDAGLDEALREVPVPSQLTRTLKRPTRRTSRTERTARWVMGVSLTIGATAAAILIAVSLRHPPAPSGGSDMAASLAPATSLTPDLETSWAYVGADAAGSSNSHLQPAAKPSAAKPSAAKPSAAAPQRLPSPIELQLAEIKPAGADTPEISNAQALADDRSPGLLGMPRGVNPLLRPAESATGGHTLDSSPWDEVPDLSIRATTLSPRGLDWPLVAGAHREFLVLTGFHPFVAPAASPRLAVCQAPLAVDAAGYEIARRFLERNEMPPPERVHTEDFLAAVPYDFPKPVGRSVGLTLYGGPSPITDGCMLLQAGVQARDIESNVHPAEHLIFLVDTSASMHWGSRIEIVRKAMHSIGAWLGKDDRLSLVTFNQGAHVLVEDVRARNIGAFLEAADALSAEGSTDMAGGLRVAYTLARQTTAATRPPVRVVLLTDGLIELDAAAAEQIERQVADAAARGISLHAIDLGQQREGDPQVAALAKAGRGGVHRATHSEELQWALREIVTGQAQVVAHDARLQITFNPKTVLEYRLLGHEATEWGGLLPAAVQADLHAGQSATALYEVRLAPGAGAVDVASAELLWYEPGQNNERSLERATATIHRNDFAATMTRAAQPLEQAAVIAYTAEVLRHSPFIFRQQRISVSAALFHALELAGEADSRLQRRDAFDEFVTFIKQEMKAHPASRRSGQER